MIITYSYTDPIIDQIPDPLMWGLEVEKQYQDINNRRALADLYVYCQANLPSYLLIRSLHELGNTFAEVISAIALLESLNIEIIAIDQPYNSSKFKNINQGDKLEQLKNIWQNIEQIIKSRKQKKGHALNRLKALPPPGKNPYGYQKGKDGYILNKSTAPIIKDFFERFLLYASIRDSVKYLEHKYNKKIANSTALNWLKNPVYRGDLAHKNKVIIGNTHTPIISREEAAQIDRLLKSHSRLKPRSATASHCLAGLVKCYLCNSPCKINSVTQRKKKDNYLYLTPVKCTQKKNCSSWHYQDILKITIQKICTELPTLIKESKAPDISIISKNLINIIKEKEQILSNLPNLIEENILDQQTVMLRSYTLENEIVDLNEQLNKLPPDNLQKMVSNLAISQFWDDLSEPEKRFYLREFVKNIYLIPQNETDKTNRIKLEFVF